MKCPCRSLCQPSEVSSDDSSARLFGPLKGSLAGPFSDLRQEGVLLQEAAHDVGQGFGTAALKLECLAPGDQEEVESPHLAPGRAYGGNAKGSCLENGHSEGVVAAAARARG